MPAGINANHQATEHIGQDPQGRGHGNSVAQKLVDQRAHRADGCAVQTAEEQRADQNRYAFKGDLQIAEVQGQVSQGRAHGGQHGIQG